MPRHLNALAILFTALLLVAQPLLPTSTALASQATYPWHHNIVTTMFYVGEAASKDNGYIDNLSSAWYTDWVQEFGCVDNPKDRQDWHPSDCYTSGQNGPKENPFYAALPCGDYDARGPLSSNDQIPWYDEENGAQVYAEGGSLLKNHWIEVKSTQSGKSVYVQWADVGPFESSDCQYVWNGGQPHYRNPDTGDRIGLDLSPAATDYLELDGYDTTSWRFIAANQVPEGPWSQIITTSPPGWYPPATPQGAIRSLWCQLMGFFHIPCHTYNQKSLSFQ